MSKRRLRSCVSDFCDSTRRNPLIHIKFRPTSTSILRVVDELPDILRYKLTNGQEMRFAALPALEDELPDEQTDIFRDALYIARQEDETFLAEIEEIDPDSADAEQKALKAERALKDKIRSVLGLPPRQTRDDLSLVDHARLHNISPNYILPLPEEVHYDGRHEDSDIQTLLLPDRLRRVAKSILEKGRSFERETGVNVLHAAFGLLEWKSPEERESYVSPLLLLEIRLDRRQSRQGVEFFVQGVDQVIVNTNLALKLETEHGIALPDYENRSVDEYFEDIQRAEPPGWHWKVRREAVFGIFPSSKIAMYHDLDPEKRPITENEIIIRLLATTGDASGTYAETYETDDPVVATHVPYLVMDADASQYSALVDIAKGKNLAIEGPPGSGKSQTIVNLIAAALSDGKKVLFVAEKLTALDVVRNRIEWAKLGNFILPLQAGRGTSEAVYESIERRLEMGRGDGRSQQTFQMRQGTLEKKRAILQGYLDALGARFGTTGLTVYQVIGHAIASSELRDALPREIRRIPIHDAEHMDPNDVESLVNEVEAFGQRLGRIARMPALWRASTAPVTSRDVAEDHAAAAGGLAATLSSYQRDILSSEIAVLLRSNPFNVDMDVVGRLLSTAAQQEDHIDIDLLEKLIDKGVRRNVRDLCGQIQERQTLVARLSNSLRDPDGWNIDNRLKASIEFTRSHGDKLNPEQHKTRLAEILANVDAAKTITAAARLLPQNWTGSGVSLSEIQAGAKRLAAKSPEARRLRHPDPRSSVVEVAAEIEDRKSTLASEIERIRNTLPGASGTHDPGELRKAAATLEDAGLVGRMGSAFKTARLTYTGILGGRREDDRRDMARRLREYADWLDACRKFNSDTRFKERFGEYFKGFETDVETIHRIVSFHATCTDVSAGNADLKHFFETADLSPVMSFAALADVPSLTLSDLETLLSALVDAREQEKHHIVEADGHIQLFRDKVNISRAEIEDILFRKSTEVELRKEIENTPVREILGSQFSGVTTRTDILSIECDLAETIAESEDTELAISAMRSGRIAAMAHDFHSFADRRADIEKQVVNLVFDLGLPEVLATAADLADRIEDLQTAANDPDSLLDRAQLKRAEDSLRTQGLGDLIDWAIGQGDAFDPARLAPIVRALIARSMADIAYLKYGETLQGYDGQDFDRIRAEIAEKDRELIMMSKRVIANELLNSARPPSGNNIGRKSSFTEMSLIYNELHKRRRRIGVRDLTRRAGRALLELKPCWMMSPLAVAQYLHEGMRFDLVVIDEASQMTPENALGAISRADQAVIVGDTKQLPPTSFFQKMLDDSDTDEDLREDSESILDMGNVAFMPVRQLRWHYRSRHSALIQFSNQWMYKGELTIFPSAQEDNPNLGVELIEVPGTYKGRRNEVEARTVVAAAVHHMTHHPDLSLGICTMNTDQKDLILEEFERERDRNPKIQEFIESWEERNDALEEFFIKNIETIQGDERDVMFISTLYGPESAGGKVHQRFGPINSMQGHRRLNVLFTRAKLKIVTFTSMKPTDIMVDDAKNLGVQMFRAWLEYSKTGHIADQVWRQGSTESPFEDYVAAQIERLGCKVVPQVGVAGYRIDLGVRHPDWPYGFLLGIECDGAAYHSSKSSRDRDRLRQEVLEGLGWRLHRIWSTDWFRNPRKEIELLKEAIDLALADARSKGIAHSEKLDTAALLGHLAKEPSVEASGDPPVDAGFTKQAPRAKIEPKVMPAQSSLPFDPPTGSDLFSTVSQVAAEPIVTLGSRVKVENITDGGKKFAFVLVEGENNPDGGRIGIHTPMGQALLDAQVGDKVEFQVGSRIKEVRILDIQQR